ncbi:MAG: hypothetical protein HFE90_11335 [Firmicutes bacterium]|nr:hypothetical protein [Bacillota bacterium]
MVINGIDTKDISVVVQGAVCDYTSTCISSIREYLPGAEIVLSTWEGTNTDGLDYDILVLSEDPGAFDCHNYDFQKVNNVERQVKSTYEGLKMATKKYAVKIRTDFSLTSANFLNWHNKYTRKNKECSFFDERLLCCTIYSRNPRYTYNRGLQLVAHPSDFFFFGLKSDVLRLYNMDLICEEDKIWFARKYPNNYVNDLPRFVPEQFLWVNFLSKYINNINMLPKDKEDIRSDIIKFSEKNLAANLILLSPIQLGITCNRDIFSEAMPETCFTHWDWKQLYFYYCKNNILHYLIYIIKVTLINIKKHIQNPLKKFLNTIIKYIKINIGFWNKFSKKYVKPHLSPKTWAKFKAYYFDYSDKFKHLIKKSYYFESDFSQIVTDKDLSIVVQGAISEKTKDTILSIRKILPNAEVILSTWEGSKVDELDYDIVVFSKDPGSNGLIRRYPHKQIHNVNREIISTFEGTKRATRQYCMKLRSDMEIVSEDFLKCYNQYSQYITSNSFFSRRIMVEGLATSESLCFSISDWWYLGRTNDLKNLFDIPLADIEDIPYFEREENKNEKPFMENIICRYTPKQYLIYVFLKKNLKIPFQMDNVFDNNQLCQDLYNKFISENLICMEPELSGIILNNGYKVNPIAYAFCMPFSRWYMKCRNHETIPNISKIKNQINIYEQIYWTEPEYFNLKNKITIIKKYIKLEEIENIQNIDFSFKKNDITFIVCGKINLNGEWNTYRCLMSIRRFFKDSTIILSTWEDEDIKSLSSLYDKLVLSKNLSDNDIDYFLKSSNMKKPNSINSQRILLYSALKNVETKYTIRLRTDFYFYNDNIFYFYTKYNSILNKRELNYKIFDSRILVYDHFTVDARMRAGGYTYMISDCLQFGLTSDLKKLWDGKMVDYSILNWFEDHKDSSWSNPDKFNHRYNAEQLCLFTAIKKALPNLELPQWYYDNTNDNYVFECEKVFASNIIVGDGVQLGISSKFENYEYDYLLTFNRLLELYLENVDPENKQCLDYLKEQYTS